MRSHADIVSRLLDPGIIAVIRTERADQVMPVCEALLAGGVSALEITLTVPDALKLIGVASRQFGARAVVGAGSVLNAAAAREVLDAGAEYLVSPITRAEIAAVGRTAGQPVMLGAYTPSEAQTAHEAGADFVKLFPADTLGPGYIKALRAPMPHLRIVPTGGVNLKNAGDFFAAGCAALGLGSSLLPADVIREKNWSELTRLAAEYVAIARQSRKL